MIIPQMFIDMNRVKSMALIQFFSITRYHRIDFAEYIKTISVQIFRSYGAYSKRIGLEIQVKDIMLDVDTAIPCGLIVTELVSNSLKHAFADGREGLININLFTSDSCTLTLIVKDNGIGLPNHVDLHNVDSLGLKQSCIGQSVGRKVDVDCTFGTTFMITFVRDNIKRKDEYD
jgi:two-component sensor histidine kinase